MVNVLIGETAVDPCLVLRPLEITHGRSGLDAQPDAPTCTFTYSGPDAPGELGDPVSITEPYPARSPSLWVDQTTRWADPGVTWLGSTEASDRFTGTVTGVDAVEQHGAVIGWAITATGTLALLGRIPVNLSRPVETDTERAAGILDAAGLPYQIDGNPTIELVADNIEQGALGALHELCATSAGLVWQDRSGRIHYGTADHRSRPTAHVLPCDIVLDGISWNTGTEAVVNHVTVTRPAPGAAHGANPHEEPVDVISATFRDDDSIAQWGFRHVDAATLASNEDDARILALTILARRAQPFWRMPGALVDWELTSDPETRAMLDLEVSTGVTLPVDVAPGPVPTVPHEWTIEGWVEAWLETGEHLTQLALSDRARSGANAGLRNWAEIAGYTWADMAAVRWLDQLVGA